MNKKSASVGKDGYAANRATLRAIAAKLQEETDIDIDELVPLIDRASAAYKICRDRIETVEKLLADRLPADSS